MSSVSPENIFQFRYINVPMLKNAVTADDGTVSGDEFTLKRLEVIGRILPNGLDIEVSTFSKLPSYDEQEIAA